MAMTRALRDTVKLSRSVYLINPVQQTTKPVSPSTSPATAPECIVMFGWMDASSKHLDKYTQGWQKLYPTSSILLVRSDQTSFYRPWSAMRRELEPAAAHLQSNFPDAIAGPSAPVLIHTMSNGGALNLKLINEMLRKNRPEQQGVPARAIIFDSCPGSTSLNIMVRALTAPLAKSFFLLRWSASALVTVLYGLMRLKDILLRRRPIIERGALDLNKELPRAARRLYLYSDADLLIPFRAVERHAAAAKQSGVKDVQLEMFKGSPHVSHARTEPQRYWQVIKDLWTGSGSAR